MSRALTLALLAGCGPTISDECSSMCDGATELLATCLDTEGSSWASNGYSDRADYRDACETWSWEQQLLERDARRRGEIEGDGHLREACEARGATLTAANATCEDYWSIDWRVSPW